MTTPTFDDVLKALGNLTTKVTAEKAAHEVTKTAADEFDVIFSAFLGRKQGMTAEQLAEVRARLEDHAATLEGMAVPPKLFDSIARPITKVGENMAGPLDDVIARIDTATNADAAVIKDLRDKLSGSMSPTDVDTAKATLTAIADHLEAIGKDPNNPVPPSPTFKKK